MTTARDSRAQALNALAAVMHAIRDDWDTPGCVAALRKITEAVPLPAIGIAAMRYCADPANLTPAHIADVGNRAWDSETSPSCPKHPDAKGRRVSGECAMCWSDRNEARERPARKPTPPPAPLRELTAAYRADLTREKAGT